LKKKTELNFDYVQFAKKLMEQISGNLAVIILKVFIEEYLAFVERNRAIKTYKGVILVCKHLLNYFSPIKTIQTISLKDGEKFLDTLKKNAPLGVHNYLRVLKAMFNKGVEWNYLRENPFTKVKLQKMQQTKPTFVTEEQLEEILNNTETEIVKDVITTGFYTGCRLGELTNLTWQDVNLNDNLLTIGNNSYQTKGRKQRFIPIHPKVKEILIKRFPKVIRKEKHFVFCKTNGYSFTGDYFSKRFKRACRKAGIDEGLHFHCLRHGAATKMILSGAPLPSVQKIMGHANIQTTMIYTHPDLESLRDAVNRL